MSSHPVFGKNVKELVYDARLFWAHTLHYDTFRNRYDELEQDDYDREEDDRGAWSQHNNQDRQYRERVTQSLIQCTILLTQQQYMLDGSHD